MKFIADELQIDTPVVLSSQYNVNSSSTQRLVDLVKSTNGTTYLTGYGSKNYLDETLFNKENIVVDWHDFEHPVYNQLHGEFIPGLSSLDFLMMKAEN